MGWRRIDFVSACDAHHGRFVRILAGKVFLERGLRSVCRSRCARLAGRYYVAERRVLGARRRLFAVRLTHHLSSVGLGREPGALDPTSRYARWMVMRRCNTITVVNGSKCSCDISTIDDAFCLLEFLLRPSDLFRAKGTG